MPSLNSFLVLLGQAAQPAAEAGKWYQAGWVTAVVALAVIIVPFLVGSWLARVFRMADYGWRIGLVLFATVAGLAICSANQWTPKLGIDLSGGVILVYEIDQSKQSAVPPKDAAEAIGKHLANNGVDASVSAAGDMVEVTLPGADAEETKRAEEEIANLYLKNTQKSIVSRPIRDGKQVLVFSLEKAKAIDSETMDKLVGSINKRINPGGQKEVTVRRMGDDRVEVIIPQADEAEKAVIMDKISTAGSLEFRILADTRAAKHHSIIDAANRQPGVREVKRNDDVVAFWVPVNEEEFPNAAKLVNNITREKDGKLEVLVLQDPYNVTGEFLDRAGKGIDNQTGTIAVTFSFVSEGANRFSKLTGSNLPDPSSDMRYQLGIILNGKLESAPTINSRISSAGQITGENYRDADVQFLVDVLNAGSLPAALNKTPVAQFTSSAQLGQDTIRAGATAMIAGTLAVLIFMFWYYRFAGFVADLAVVLNVILVLAFMMLIKAHLTLAGLAGLVLSVGMSVDANVLIYERMREEMERGAALRMAIRNGFSRAMSTIIDSNLTTLIVGIVLYVIGTDQLRGFATTLVMGLTLNLFTAVFCSRVLFDIAERIGWLKELRMRKLFGKTSFDFTGWMKPAIALSVVLIAVGIAGVWKRGAGLFGIDFTGGTAVQLVFKQDADISEVRNILQESLPDVSVSAVGVGDQIAKNTRFNVTTSQEKIEEVEKTLQDAFPGKLKTYSMGFTLGETASTGDAEEKTATDEPTGDGKKSAETAAPATSAGDTLAAAGVAGSTTDIAGAAAPTSAKLKFPDEINLSSLNATITEALLAAGYKEDALPAFTLDSPDPEYVPGSARPLEDWNLTIALPRERAETLLASIKSAFDAKPIFPTSNTVGGKVVGDSKTKAVIALVVSNLLIILYIWVRFQNLVFGLAAVLALVHDVAIAVGALALSYWLAPYLGFLLVDPFKISLEVVAALLTIVGFSINDTIVIFDRIREIRGKSAELTNDMVNLALNQTLSRTILTSGTVFLVTVILYALGGEGIHAFAFTMLMGVISGTYSSLFIAAPVLLWFRNQPASRGATVERSSGIPVSAAGRA